MAEMHGHLEARGVEAAEADAAVAELLDAGYLDDARYAEQFADDRRRLDGWGAERIARKLTSVGVAVEHVEAALGAQDGDAELEAAVALLRRRFREPPADDRGRDRALGLLVRKGYGLDVAYDAVRAFERAT